LVVEEVTHGFKACMIELGGHSIRNERMGQEGIKLALLERGVKTTEGERGVSRRERETARERSTN
jgi:hypothetical protein